MFETRTTTHLPLEVLIFSKDRACQLDALLRSMDRFFNLNHKKTVLYTVTTADYYRSYVTVIGDNPNVHFVQEESFKDDLLSVVKNAADDHRHIMFLVDDVVFVKSYDGGENLDLFAQDENILTVSLRLGQNITYCQPRDIDTLPHDFSHSNMWFWQKAHTGYWNYPMSLDGHIFRAVDIIDLVENLEFGNPNTLEAALANNPIQKPLMLAEKDPYLVNLALNRVQDVFNNPHGAISTEQLNKEFLNGKRIDIDPIIIKSYNSCHIIPEIQYKRGKV